MSVIGKLRVLLGLDSSEFVSGTKKAEQSNEKLNKSLKQTKNTVDATTASTTRHAQAAQQSAQATQQQTTQAQQATKKFNTLNFQIQQVARELPSLALGPQMFFLAISNNLPMLTDEVARARKEYKELTAAGEKATPVWKQMLSGILSWQTALVVGITLLVAYGKEIGNFVSELFTGKKAFDAAEVAASNFHRAMTEGVVNAAEETTKLDLLYKAATDNKKSYEDRKTAAEELQSIYPAYFGNLATEQIMIGEAVSKYNDLRTAIIETAKAKAASNTITRLSEDLQLIQANKAAYHDLEIATNNAKASAEAYFNAPKSQRTLAERLFGDESIEGRKFEQLEQAETQLKKSTEAFRDGLLKLSGGKELWDKIEKDFDGNVLNFAETINRTIEQLTPQAELGLIVKSPEDLNEEAKKVAQRAAAAADQAYKSTLAYSESENSKAIAAIQKEQDAYGTTIAYMEKMLQLRREQETYAKSEAEYQQRKKINDELQKQIELMKQAYYAPGSEADLKARISALQDEISKLDPIADRMRIKEAMAQIKQYEEEIKKLPQNYKIEFEVDLKSDADQLKDYFGNNEFLKRLKEKTQQAEEIAEQFKSVFTSAMIDSFNILAESIAGVSNMNAGQAVASLLSPLADMAISAGTIIMFSGDAIEKLKAALTSFLGVGAIAAGAALVGVGIAAKAGLSALAKGSSSAANTTNYNTFTGGSNGGYSNNGAYRYAMANVAPAGTNVTVDVKGALKGEDIALAVKKVTYNKSR